MKQFSLWHEPPKTIQHRIRAPFEVDSSIAIAPGYRRIFWRLLSFRNPNVRWNPNLWHFEGVLRDEIVRTDIHLQLNPETNLLEVVEEQL